MKVLQEYMTKFTDIASGAIQIMVVAFEQQWNVMVPPGNDYPPNDASFPQWMKQQNNDADTRQQNHGAGFSQWMRQESYQYAERDG